MNLDVQPRLRLAHLPTPLEPAPRLGAALGVANLWVKRDDCTGLGMGGNKARKLEFLLAEAQSQGADVLLTTGGVQSNHARMTAAAACKLGMQSILFLTDPQPAKQQGNLLLDRIYGAEVRFLPGAGLAEGQRAMDEAAETLRAAGRCPYIIPVGGSTAVGCLGYVAAVRELADQASAQSLRIDAMVTAAGSTGTLAGRVLGRQAFMPETRLYGISVSPPAGPGRGKCARIVREAAAKLGVSDPPTADDIDLRDDWLGAGYGVPTPAGVEAIRLAATCEGLLLDPVYTGKALSGLRGLAEQGELRPEETVVFWHTGGAPALFAFNELPLGGDDL
jgi:D-cysteine desulfhydrase family pyridoxal phosphate-dependent enzyme